VVEEIQNDISRLEEDDKDDEEDLTDMLESAELKIATESLPNRRSIREKYNSMKQLTKSMKIGDPSTLDDIFMNVDVLVVESLRKQYWQAFTESEKFTKLKNFLWFFDRPVLVDDFFSMRVLGRGGFGSVTGKQHTPRVSDRDPTLFDVVLSLCYCDAVMFS
jgi:hypothetical protein